MDRVYFEYRESRKADFLNVFLKEFRGVVVSDFFTGYDSLQVPQQKCVIHLIRDMNEDLLNAPFDDEFRGFVQRFATLFQGIVKTVHEFGLTRQHLQKHKKEAQEFIGWVRTAAFSSLVAGKYQKRIAKYGARLFTFLDYDGVPWNNNNAEHAIKSFAKYRRFADGRFTEASICDYLVILSVVQTCEFQNIDVLEFLLSLQPNPIDPQDSLRQNSSLSPCGIRGFGSRSVEKPVLDRILALRKKPRDGRRMSYENIADLLNTEGVTTRKGGRWWGTTIRNIVKGRGD